MSDPILPIIMLTIIPIFPKNDKDWVNPVVRPRFEKADTDSKRTPMNETPVSVISKNNVVTKIQLMLRKTIAIDLKTWSRGIRLPRIFTEVLPVMAALAVAIRIVKTVTLTPLPVDPGDEPIKVRSMIISNVASCRELTGTVTNPVLRNATA